MVTLDKPSNHSALVGRIFNNLKQSCRRDYLRKRFIIRWLVILVVVVLLVQYFAKGRLNVDVRFGVQHEHSGVVEFKREARADIEYAETDISNQLHNLPQGLQPPRQDNLAVQQHEQNVKKEELPPPKEEVKKDEKIHAFVGKANLPPVYLDFIDVNQPWDKAAEVYF